MDLNNMDKEKAELRLQACYSPVKRKRKYTCSLDLFNGSVVAGITETLGNSNNINSVSADPAEELKEKDHIRGSIKSYRSSSYNSLVSFNPHVDCTLSLGIPHPLPTPEQRVMDMYKKSSMEEVIEVIKSTLLSPKIKCSNLEASGVPSGGLDNISSSSLNNNFYKSRWSTATNATITSNPISSDQCLQIPTAYSGSMFTDSKDIMAHSNNATDLVSEIPPTKPKETCNSNPLNTHNGSSISNNTSDESTRWCFTCHTTTTPLWRSGPMGPKSLCNACGIRYKKKERRAASSMAAAAENNN
ncbi:hypothetical protein SUGI_0339400, partial [Cryptomeria japonica]